jgi:hypothetical protein
LAWYIFLDLIGVLHLSAHELGLEGHLGPYLQRLGRLPLDLLDVLVPGRCVVRVRDIVGHLGTRPLDFDVGEDVDIHQLLLSAT